VSMFGAKLKVDVITNDGRVAGMVGSAGNLADLLNKRAVIPLTEAQAGPLSGAMAPVKVAEIDPYETILVGAATGSAPVVGAIDRTAMSKFRDAYDAVYEAGKIRVAGTIYAIPGHDPMDTLDRSIELAIPIFDLAVTLNGAPIPFARDAAIIGRPNVKVVSARKKAA
jgi:hypothetical protein